MSAHGHTLDLVWGINLGMICLSYFVGKMSK